MSKKSRGGQIQSSAFEFWKSGEPVPKAFLERRIATVRRGLDMQFKQRQEISQRYATYWRQIQKASKDGDRVAAGAMEGVLQIHKKLAKKKITASAPLGLGGIFPVTYGETVTPPFNYGFSFGNLAHYGPPVLSASANNVTGQITTSAISNAKKASGGWIYSEMGIHFKAKFAPATLLASINPSCSFQWWTNSINDNQVISSGASSFGMYNPQIPQPYNMIIYTAFDAWFENQRNALRFDFATGQTIPASFELEILTSSIWLVIYVNSQSWIIADGWPGSLAGSVNSVTVPSINLTLNPPIISGPER